MAISSTAEIIAELPEMPPPTFQPIYLVLSYYVGPGCNNKSWKIHKVNFSYEELANKFAEQLDRRHRHRRIVKIG